MMKIMLNYYNDLTVLLSTIFRELGFEIDYMGRPNRGTLELATKYSPESWCYDTKLMLGQAIEAINRNDDILTIPGAWGGAERNCFVGYLTRGVMERKLEKITGKKVNIWFFNVNPAEIMLSGYTAVFKNLSMLKKYSKIKFFRSRLMKALMLGIKKMKLAANLKETILTSPEIIDINSVFLIYNKFIDDMIFYADTIEEANSLFKDSENKIKNLKTKKIKKILKIGIVGDYAHTLFSLHPFFDIEKFLLEQGVIVNQPLSFTNYYNFRSPLYTIKNRNDLKKIFPQNVSGSDAVTLLSALYLKEKVDGIIHIRTFGCMPEEVVNEVILTNKKDFPPVLSLSYDAHTTEENLKVRIEAFIDMINSKQKKN
jgi:predicted nucleotide-binding protein (sugar kinase/HSP70/actin superfamily)